ncbi:MAG: hypothetical protein KDD83_06225 [Caldilineaceae bacterium]|nr:hypothetical protein [Caldilineaceae bacterium]
MQTDHPFDQSGTVEIHVVGNVDMRWMECMTGMTSSARRGDQAGEWITVLLGWLPDQAALNGVLNALYTRQLALRYVSMLTRNDTPFSSALSNSERSEKGDET